MRSRLRTLLYHVSISTILWAVLVIAFRYWIDYEVHEEYRTGARTDTGGDNIVIPIVGFAITLFELLVAVNVLVFIAYAIVGALRRRSAALPASRVPRS
jgi:hypothetical protein